MRIMKPSEEKGLRIERFNVPILPSSIATTPDGQYYVGTGLPVPPQDTIQLINLKMDVNGGVPSEIAKVLNVGYTLEVWPTSENEQAIWFGANPNIEYEVDFEIIYIYQY